MNRPCPCGSGAAFAVCCAPYLSGTAQPPTAEALMRSRYSAFCEGAADYLIATHRGEAGPAGDRADLLRTIAGTEWLHLTVLATQKGGPDDAVGVVEFAAAFRATSPGPMAVAPEIQQLHERSRFVREDGRWLYTDGERLPPHRPGPNAACWCGSGRKTKRCHG